MTQKKRQTYRNLKSLPEARELFSTRFRNLLMAPEIVPVRQALGRILANAITAVRSVPSYNASAVDGMAVRASSTFSALPETPVNLTAGIDAIPVNTGDPLPEGMDAVVMIEKVETTGVVCEIREAVYPWQHVRKMGEDIVKGEILLPAFRRIRPYDQGAIMAAGIMEVAVFRKPRVLIIPTGDEIVLPENVADRLEPGAILEVNGQVLASMAAECGAESILSKPISDNLENIKEAITSGIRDGFDVIMTIAGSSTGSEDLTPAAMAQLGELLVHGVTVMPGKPTLLASIQNRPVIGIPGYPVSAVVSFGEFVRPLLYRIQGIQAPATGKIEACMGRKLPSRPGLEEHVRVILGKVGERVVVIPLTGGAGMMTSLVRADGIVRIPPEISGYSEGETVSIELLNSEESLENRLLTLGSHDLAIDLLASMVKEKSEGRITISSSNVGSLGGLIAIEKGIAHFAGAHLLDTKTGDYNRSYLQKYVPNTPTTLITLVRRWQGFMIVKGNPVNVRGIKDLVRPDITFVNRQAGSGTRILLDYELAKEGMDPAAINGYRTEEYTHMSVAMAVTSGRADVGLGIMAAAKALDLDFIPVSRERYDLVVPTWLLEDERMALLLEIIRSSSFKEQVLALGGYEVEETGKIQ
ncbi:MAG TPA: molybdopterin biosynthesis protein [Acidobacteriota bacterium]|nr:molybdopterin biosynthesis protein [Acidobacteriota bacterium]